MNYLSDSDLLFFEQVAAKQAKTILLLYSNNKSPEAYRDVVQTIVQRWERVYG